MLDARSDGEYITQVTGIVDGIYYQENTGETFADVYSEELEQEPYDFYQGVVVFEPLTPDEEALDLQPGDRVVLGVFFDEEYGEYGVDILSKI